MIAGLLIAGLCLFLAFWLLDKVVAVWVTGRKFQYAFQRWVQLIRVLVWCVFGLYALYSFLQVDYLVSLAILAFLLIAGLDFWRNAFAGVLLHLEGRLSPGDVIKATTAEGNLTALRLTHTELITPEGELIRLPNQEVRRTVLRQTPSRRDLEVYNFIVQPKEDQVLDKQAVQEFARQCPWVNASRPIEVIKRNDGTFNLKAFLIDQQFREEAEAFFKNWE
jgi:small-conductance mechanosensitive channel